MSWRNLEEEEFAFRAWSHQFWQRWEGGQRRRIDLRCATIIAIFFVSSSSSSSSSSSAAKMWSPNRRKDLLFSSLLLLVLNLLIYLDIRPPFFEPEDPAEPGQNDGQITDDNLRAAFADGVEALEYMYDSQAGRAKVCDLQMKMVKSLGELDLTRHHRQVAETVERPFNGAQKEVRHCSGKAWPTTIAPSRKWTRNGDFHVFSAYLDRRHNGLFGGGIPTVRILASAFGIRALNRTYYCHLRVYEENEKKNSKKWSGNVVKAHIRWIWQRAWDPRNEFYNAFLISCPWLFDEEVEGQEAAVLVSKSRFCVTYSNNDDVGANFMLIMGSTPTTKDNTTIHEQSVLGLQSSEIKIAVCVKGLAFLDESELSARWIAQWIELQWALGASAVGIYVYWVPESVRNVLDKMAERGRVELIDLELPGNSPNQPFSRHQFIWRNRQQKRRHELIPYNDCFYRYSSSHHFVLIVDTDEVVVPVKHKSWQEMLAEALSSKAGQWRAEPSSMSILNVFKFRKNQQNEQQQRDEGPFDNRQRSGIVQERDQYGKSFVSTRSVSTVFNHFALHRLHANVSKTFYVDKEDALKLHWKNQCPHLELGNEVCSEVEQNMVDDNLLSPYRDKVKKFVDEYMVEK